jgi:hypothetical protein
LSLAPNAATPFSYQNSATCLLLLHYLAGITTDTFQSSVMVVIVPALQRFDY